MKKESDVIDSVLFDVANKMAVAARTAPKGKGDNNLVLMIAEKEDIKLLSERLTELGEKVGSPAFIRDAQNILQAPVMLLLGSKIKPLGLKTCGLCGHGNCADKLKFPDVPCAFNTGDLGIAIGSAVSVASDMRVDNRVMYTVGQAVIDMNLMGDDVKIVYAIPLTATSKNPFFDRG